MNEPSRSAKNANPNGEIPGKAWTILVVSAVAFGVNFWAWPILSPLGPLYGNELDLSAFTQAVVVALPVVIGSVERVPVGALTDQYGARSMFTILSIATIIPVLLVGFFGKSAAMLMVGGVLLGLGGTTFAIGVPAVNAWFPPRRHGMALGLFGIGTGGTAVASFITLPLIRALGELAPFLIAAGCLVVVAVLCSTLLREPPGKPAGGGGSAFARSLQAMRMGVTWRLSMLYSLTFGGFVAFSVYLPTYLKNAFALTPADAAARTAGFVALAVLARPDGRGAVRPSPPRADAGRLQRVRVGYILLAVVALGCTLLAIAWRVVITPTWP